MAIIDGNITWFDEATNPNENALYPKVGYLNWFGRVYDIYELKREPHEPTYWLDKGIRVSLNSDSIKLNKRSTYIRPGELKLINNNWVALGDRFDSMFLSGHLYDDLIPPECRLPTKEDVNRYLRNNTNLSLMKLLHFVDEDDTNIYGSRDQRIWLYWDHRKGGAVRHYRSSVIPNAIDRVRIKHADCKWENNKLNLTTVKSTSRVRWNHGAIKQFGDWVEPNVDNRKRAWWGVNSDQPFILPAGNFDIFEEGMSLKEMADAIVTFLETNPSESNWWTPFNYWSFVVPSIYMGIITTDYMYWRGGRSNPQHWGSPRTGSSWSGRGYQDISNIPLIHFLLERPLRPLYYLVAVLFPQRWWRPTPEWHAVLSSKISEIDLEIGWSKWIRDLFYKYGKPGNLTRHDLSKDPINGFITYGIITLTTFIGGWTYQQSRWGELRCMVKPPPPTPPPDEPTGPELQIDDREEEDPPNHPDPIFFGSGY